MITFLLSLLFVGLVFSAGLLFGTVLGYELDEHHDGDTMTGATLWGFRAMLPAFVLMLCFEEPAHRGTEIRKVISMACDGLVR